MDEKLLVLFWNHGGGWIAGDKCEVALKPGALTDRGLVFVSTNYRLLPDDPVTQECFTFLDELTGKD